MNLRNYIIISLKGIGMGAADVVPGVSGGTIAFISGIYDELLDSIKSINLKALQILKSEGIPAFWKHINGKFLISLFLGIGISIVSLAKAITWLLDNHPVYVWSFFFGLIVASVAFISKQIRRWRLFTVIMLIIGTALAYYITTITAVASETTNPAYIFLCGMIAICAMILPGISGSFILLLMGAYQLIIGSLSNLVEFASKGLWSDVMVPAKTIVVFAGGCVLGLISFSHMLSWLLKNHHNATIALLTGFLIGSLNKVWPWKEITHWRTDKHGIEKPFLYENVLPAEFTEISIAILLAAGGYLLIFLLEKTAARTPEE